MMQGTQSWCSAVDDLEGWVGREVGEEFKREETHVYIPMADSH